MVDFHLKIMMQPNRHYFLTIISKYQIEDRVLNILSRYTYFYCYSLIYSIVDKTHSITITRFHHIWWYTFISFYQHHHEVMKQKKTNTRNLLIFFPFLKHWSNRNDSESCSSYNFTYFVSSFFIYFLWVIMSLFFNFMKSEWTLEHIFD